MNEKKKVLLMGGTGAMGVYLIPELLALNYEVYVTSRHPHTSDKEGLFYITGNAKDLTFLDSLIEQKFDVIVDFMIYNTEQFRQRCERLLKATDHYLFLSSYRVYGDNKGAPITEASPRLLDSVQDAEYLATDEYGLTKARQENILREAAQKNWTILRPAITYSTDRFQLGTMEANEFLRRCFEGKEVIFPRQMLQKQATLSWAGDVAKMISRMILNDKAMGETFTVSTTEHHTWQEIVTIYEELADLKVQIVDLQVYYDVIRRPWQIKYDRMLDRVIDNSKALEISGLRQEDLMPLKQGLTQELAEFRKNPVFRRVDRELDKRMDDAIAEKKLSVGRKILRKLRVRQRLGQVKRLVRRVLSKLFQLPGLRQVKKLIRSVLHK